MKTLRFIGMALLAVLICVNFASCSSEDNIPSTDEQEFYTVKIGLTGEILNITDEPLSRAEGESESTNNIYGIQVYSTPDKELEQGQTATWTAYAYGLFDNPNNISILLIKGYKYKFKASIVIDAKTKLYSHLDGGVQKYNYPFTLSTSTTQGESTFNNSFNFTTDFLNMLEKGTARDIDFIQYGRPNLERYYGIKEEYIPSANNSVSIDMKRTSFGAKFVVEGENATNGILQVSINSAPEMLINLGQGEKECFDIFTFANVLEAWENSEYSETIAVTFSWQKSDGATIPLGTHNITYKRNKTTKVTIKIAKPGSDSNIGFVYDDEEIGDMVEDEENDVTIQDGELVDTNVGTEGE